jgi:hypothetical protein
MISIGTLLAFTVVCAGIVVLRFPPIDFVAIREAGAAPPVRPIWALISPPGKVWGVPLMLLGYFSACIVATSLFQRALIVGPWWLPLPALAPVLAFYLPLQVIFSI